MVKAIVFMGMPHCRADVASWANFAARAFSTLQMSAATNTRLLSDLKRNSETLKQISQQFVERGSAIRMKTFYETVKSDYANCLVCFLEWWATRVGLIWSRLGCGKGFSYFESAQRVTSCPDSRGPPKYVQVCLRG